MVVSPATYARKVMVIQKTIEVRTSGRGTIELTRQAQDIVRDSGIKQGICNVFIQHTSASLMLCENADPTVRSDMERFMETLVPDGDPMFRHTAEGTDDMSAHIRNVLTENSISIPVNNGQCALGTWQGIYLWEHRYHQYNRKVTITVYGE